VAVFVVVQDAFDDPVAAALLDHVARAHVADGALEEVGGRDPRGRGEAPRSRARRRWEDQRRPPTTTVAAPAMIRIAMRSAVNIDGEEIVTTPGAVVNE
jgi:hypothetical protein